MTDELKNKLRLALEKNLGDECQVVYILSRIRKIIELEELRKRYRILNIYCNWCLHTRINNTEDFKDILEEFVNNAESRHYLLYFEEFKKQFRNFLKEELAFEITDNYLNKFVQILTNVISDTPISTKKIKKITITINPNDLPRRENEITYKITQHDE